MEIDISFLPKQLEALKASEKYPVVFFGGARGGGKSALVRRREFLRRMEYPNTTGLIIRKTYNELYQNHILPFFKDFPITKKWYKDSKKAIFYPNGSITFFAYLANKNDVYNFLGLEYEDISVDEAVQHTWDTIKLLRGSLRTTKNIKPRMFLTSNPMGIGHFELKRVFIDRVFKEDENPDDFYYVKATIKDNPILLKKDPDYIKRLKALPHALREAYLNGNWDVFEGLAFEGWHPKFIDVLPERLSIWGGYDWGYNHPFAFVLFGKDIDNKIYVISYITGTKHSIEEQARKILDTVLFYKKKFYQDRVLISAGRDVWAKRDERSTIFEELNKKMAKHDVYIIHATVNRTQGLNFIREQIYKDNIIFKKGTEHLFKKLSELQIDPDNPEDILKIDYTENNESGDDLYDAFRYGILQFANPPSEEPSIVKPGSGEEILRLVKLQEQLNNLDF